MSAERDRYEATKVDVWTWMVKRIRDYTYEESLLRDVPSEATADDVIQLAIERGSWA